VTDIPAHDNLSLDELGLGFMQETFQLLVFQNSGSDDVREFFLFERKGDTCPKSQWVGGPCSSHKEALELFKYLLFFLLESLEQNMQEKMPGSQVSRNGRNGPACRRSCVPRPSIKKIKKLQNKNEQPKILPLLLLLLSDLPQTFPLSSSSVIPHDPIFIDSIAIHFCHHFSFKFISSLHCDESLE
jgi:hypothetical protein